VGGLRRGGRRRVLAGGGAGRRRERGRGLLLRAHDHRDVLHRSGRVGGRLGREGDHGCRRRGGRGYRDPRNRPRPCAGAGPASRVTPRVGVVPITAGGRVESWTYVLPFAVDAPALEARLVAGVTEIEQQLAAAVHSDDPFVAEAATHLLEA